MSKVFIEETTLSAIGNAIREKTGKSDLIAPGMMPDEIAGIETGGGGVEVEPIVLTGDQTSGCSTPMAIQYIKLFGDTITTKDITNANKMFQKASSLETIPFDINMSSSASYTTVSNMFSACNNLKELPRIYNAKPDGYASVFFDCNNLREIPDDYFKTWDWTYLDTLTGSYSGMSANVFYRCFSLRKFPMDLFYHSNKLINASYSPYNNTFYTCCVLDEIIGMPVSAYEGKSNAFLAHITHCFRLKDYTFETNEDGTPKIAKWANQTIDFVHTGYGDRYTEFTDYNSGITVDKEVKDDATYQALKNDPDWSTTKIEYSRYNHDSAVRTINSLPDTSAYLAENGGTNTIKFTGRVGSATDGGAINTLTEEEIAVATAKGWTVSLV